MGFVGLGERDEEESLRASLTGQRAAEGRVCANGAPEDVLRPLGGSRAFPLLALGRVWGLLRGSPCAGG